MAGTDRSAGVNRKPSPFFSSSPVRNFPAGRPGSVRPRTTGRKSSPGRDVFLRASCLQGHKQDLCFPAVSEKPFFLSQQYLHNKIRLWQDLIKGAAAALQAGGEGDNRKCGDGSEISHYLRKGVALEDNAPYLSTPHISLAYSRTLRSLENFPIPATLRMALRVHSSLSRNVFVTSSWQRR